MIPKLEVRQLTRITWSLVSKATLRSREKKRGTPVVNFMIDRIEKVNRKGFS